jgi:thiol:disulfide interchange protein DsbA
MTPFRAFLLMCVTAVVSSVALAQPYQEGQHYDAIDAASNMPDDKVVVTEAFAYPCPACRNFLPVITAWAEQAPDYVEVQKLPVALRPSWAPFARAYYTAQVMDLGPEAHEKTFKALHDERQRITSMEDIGKLYEEFGVDAGEFVEMSESFAVESQMGRNRTEVRRFGIRGTPSVIVQGKYRMKLRAFDSYQEMMRAVDVLVAREAEALGLTASGETSAP